MRMRAAREAGASVVEKRHRAPWPTAFQFAASPALHYGTCAAQETIMGDDERNLNLHVLHDGYHGRSKTSGAADIIALVEVCSGREPVSPIGFRSLISSLFSFALDADLVETNPCARLRKRRYRAGVAPVMSDAEIRLRGRAVASACLPKPWPRHAPATLHGHAPGRSSSIAYGSLTRSATAEKRHGQSRDTDEKFTGTVRTACRPWRSIHRGRQRTLMRMIGFYSRRRLAPTDQGTALAVAMRRLIEERKPAGPGSDHLEGLPPPTPPTISRRTFATMLLLNSSCEGRSRRLPEPHPQDVGSRPTILLTRKRVSAQRAGSFHL